MNKAPECLKQSFESLFASAVHWYHDPSYGEFGKVARGMQRGAICSALRIDRPGWNNLQCSLTRAASSQYHSVMD